MQYETCCHIKEHGAYCGSPKLQNSKYCYYHLKDRGRRLRRARALRDNLPYRLEIPALQDLDSVQVALSEIVQALGTGQLDHRVAGKMLYAIQQAASLIKFKAQLEAAQSQTAQQPAAKLSFASASYQGAASAAPEAVETTLDSSPCDSATSQAAPTPAPAHVQDYPGFEQEFGLNPGSDIDAETDWTLRKAEQEVELRHVNDFPAPPPGMRIASAQYRIYREEVYQSLNIQLNRMKHELRDYYEEKRKEGEKQLSKEMLSATVPEQHTKTA